MRITRFTQRYSNGFEIICEHNHPSVCAMWLLRVVIEHEYDGNTYQELDGGLCRDLDGAILNAEAAVEFHSRNNHHDERRAG